MGSTEIKNWWGEGGRFHTGAVKEITKTLLRFPSY